MKEIFIVMKMRGRVEKSEWLSYSSSVDPSDPVANWRMSFKTRVSWTMGGSRCPSTHCNKWGVSASKSASTDARSPSSHISGILDAAQRPISTSNSNQPRCPQRYMMRFCRFDNSRPDTCELPCGDARCAAVHAFPFADERFLDIAPGNRNRCIFNRGQCAQRNPEGKSDKKDRCTLFVFPNCCIPRRAGVFRLYFLNREKLLCWFPCTAWTDGSKRTITETNGSTD